MTITQIVLASLNIIAAGVLLWLASMSAYARTAWTQYIRGLERQRDGIATGSWLKDLNDNQLDVLRGRVTIDRSVVENLDPALRTRIINQLGGDSQEGDGKLKSDHAVRQELARLFWWNTGQRLVVEKQGDKSEVKLLDDREFQQNNPPTKLFEVADPGNAVLKDEGIRKLAAYIGPEGFAQILRIAIRQQYPRLELDEREGLRKLYFARRQLAELNTQIAKVQAEVKDLTERRDFEKTLLQQSETENQERRREITRLQADVEEALVAYTLALGREADKKREQQTIQQRSSEVAQTSTKLVDEIRAKEAPDRQR